MWLLQVALAAGLAGAPERVQDYARLPECRLNAAVSSCIHAR